ncbi:MAG: hypothetical protein HYS22_01150 [Deltaproteobacteria bacterium]|nr:hypothetical protein [Deltaproteobacteria bacterium]
MNVNKPTSIRVTGTAGTSQPAPERKGKNELTVAGRQIRVDSGSLNNRLSGRANGLDVSAPGDLPPPMEPGSDPTPSDPRALHEEQKGLVKEQRQVEKELNKLHQLRDRLDSAGLDSNNPVYQAVSAKLDGKIRELEDRQTAIQERMEDIAFEAETAGEEGATTEDQGPSAATVAADIAQLRTEIQGDANLSDDEKEEKVRKLDLLLAELGRNPNPEKMDELLGKLDEVKVDYDGTKEFPQKARELAEWADVDPEEVVKAAQKQNIDLKNIPNPPTEKVILFLAELKEGFKSEMADIKRLNGELEDQRNGVNDRIQSENGNVASDPDDYSYDLGLVREAGRVISRNTEKDKEHIESREQIRDSLIEGLKILYPGATIEKGSLDSENINKNWINADLIEFNGKTYDVVHNDKAQLRFAEPTTSKYTEYTEWDTPEDTWGDVEGGDSKPVTIVDDDHYMNTIDVDIDHERDGEFAGELSDTAEDNNVPTNEFETD